MNYRHLPKIKDRGIFPFLSFSYRPRIRPHRRCLTVRSLTIILIRCRSVGCWMNDDSHSMRCDDDYWKLLSTSVQNPIKIVTQVAGFSTTFDCNLGMGTFFFWGSGLKWIDFERVGRGVYNTWFYRLYKWALLQWLIDLRSIDLAGSQTKPISEIREKNCDIYII